RTITMGLGWSAHSDGSTGAGEPPRAAKADARGKASGTPAQAAGAGGDDTLPWDVTAIHQALLAGMLSHIGVREAESREVLGARGAKFMIFPGSSLAKKPPRWVMAAELV
ncbi:oligonucleotide/oligosaccharide-binding fold domain-containing protein, partial [Nocardia cyriacigeorgica]|uniref:oligonucleotide/oligosaccharide-binding fold domain-containing protein n=1 Tax=Nocardia cyriacigeorgica TaxID=135487 RepID=UPI001E45B384